MTFRVRVTEQVNAPDSNGLARTWITLLRASGYRVGFEEVGIREVNGDMITADSMTAPLEDLAKRDAQRNPR